MNLSIFPARFSVQPFSFVILMNQEQFLLLVLEPEFHVLSHDEEADLPSPYIDSGIGISQECSPKNDRYPRIAFHVKEHKIHEYEGILKSYQLIFNDSLGIPYGRVNQLHTHHGRGKSRIT